MSDIPPSPTSDYTSDSIEIIVTPPWSGPGTPVIPGVGDRNCWNEYFSFEELEEGEIGEEAMSNYVNVHVCSL